MAKIELSGWEPLWLILALGVIAAEVLAALVLIVIHLTKPSLLSAPASPAPEVQRRYTFDPKEVKVPLRFEVRPLEAQLNLEPKVKSPTEMLVTPILKNELEVRFIPLLKNKTPLEIHIKVEKQTGKNELESGILLPPPKDVLKKRKENPPGN